MPGYIDGYMNALAFKADLAGKNLSNEKQTLEIQAARDALADHDKMRQLAMDAAKPKNPGDPPPTALETAHNYTDTLLANGLVEAGMDNLKKVTEVESSSAEAQIKLYDHQQKVFSEMVQETASIETEDQWRDYLHRRSQLHPEVLTDPKLAPQFMALQNMEWSPELMQQIRDGASSQLDKVKMRQAEAAAKRSEADTRRIDYETNVAIPTRLKALQERTTAYTKVAGAKAAGAGKPPSAGLVTAITDLAAVDYPELSDDREKARSRARPVAQMAKDLMDAGMDSWKAVETAYEASKKDPRKPWGGLREDRVSPGVSRMHPIEATTADLKKTPPRPNFYYSINGKTYLALDQFRLKEVEVPALDDTQQDPGIEPPDDEEDM